MGLFDKILGKKAERPKVVVVGLDGAPHSLLERFCEEGVMPHLASLREEGTISAMDTPLPEISSTSWATFFTGRNPGKHGIYGFSDLRPASYKLYFPNLKDVRGDTLWDAAGKADRRSIVLNVPSTYPARPLNGILCSGFVALDLRRATYPESAFHYLNGMGYRIDADTRLPKKSKAEFVEDVKKTLALREKALLHFFDTEEWDLFVGVITATDRLMHFCYGDFEEKGELYEEFLGIYRESDRILGEIAKRVREMDDTHLILMSDHGFTYLEKQVYLNHWLEQEGYLSWESGEPKQVEEIAAGARAFALDPARIYVHTKGRYPKGEVEPGDAAMAIREEIAEKIATLEIDGKPVVKEIHRREELYSGPLLASAPDLVLVPHRGFDLKGAIGKGVLSNREIFTGMHTHDDAVLYIRGHELRGAKPHVMDIAPTALALLGLDIPADMDGRVLIQETAAA